MTPVIDAQYLITLKWADSLADHLTNDQIARALQTPSDDCNAAWGTKLQAVWKKEFAPATVGRRKARVDETNQIDFGVAHLHLWMAQPPTGPSRYGRRSPYREEFGGWPWHKWLEKAWRRIIGCEKAAGKLTWTPSQDEVEAARCKEPADAFNKIVHYFKKTGRGTIRRRFQNRVPANWIQRGETSTKFYGYMGLSPKKEVSA